MNSVAIGIDALIVILAPLFEILFTRQAVEEALSKVEIVAVNSARVRLSRTSGSDCAASNVFTRSMRPLSVVERIAY